MRAAVLTISTTRARGEGDDVSGTALVELCEAAGLETTHAVLPDDRGAIADELRRLADDEDVRFVFTTGGTGMTPDDVTPEATLDVIEREAPGYAETIRAESRKHIAARHPHARRVRHPRADADRQLPRLAERRAAVVARRRADAEARGRDARA